MTEDKMVGWHPQLNGHEFEQSLGVGDGQGSLVCFSPWGHKESDTTERLSGTELIMACIHLCSIIQSIFTTPKILCALPPHNTGNH